MQQKTISAPMAAKQLEARLKRQLLADIENDYVLRAEDIVTTVHSLEADKQELVEALRLSESVLSTMLSRAPVWHAGKDRQIHPQVGISIIREALSKHGGAP